eukprot:GHUV01001133.1.p1 GENE.GHUV01001133.1~~GHUV01001133.1.p1  ORF type:complete len:379 (+),score=111.33 GHUV01001133.1:278-1414(+)
MRTACGARAANARTQAINQIVCTGVRPLAAHRCSAVREPHDVCLSSGFLAFAQHSAFLQAVEEAGIPVGGVMGTSAGALTGSLYAAGYTPRQVAAALSEKAPIDFLRPSLEPWRGGLLSLEGVVERLRELLPPTFEGLERDFAVGVVTEDGQHVLIDHGPLPEAVAASAAIPFIFANVEVPGLFSGLKDGGVVDRVGLSAWRQRRRQQHKLGRRGDRLPPCLVHIIERSSPFSGTDDAEAAGEAAVHFVRCPKSGVNFFDLGDFDRQFTEAFQRASTSLDGYQAALAALPQTAGQQQQLQPASSVWPSNSVVLSMSSASNGSKAHSASPALVVAAASSSSSGSAAGAAAAAAGLSAVRHTPLTARNSSVRRAVQDDSS